jgi:hypothetical protein
MRDDMSKVLVERERVGSKDGALHRRRNRRKTKKVDEEDDSSTVVSMGRGRQYGYNQKQLNENLSPLRGFLRANVGRVWDDVYSEMRQNIRWDNIVQQHILQHLWQYVERNVVLIDGIAHGRHSYYEARYYPLRQDQFYVHPESGLLLFGSAPTYRQSNRSRARQAQNDWDSGKRPAGNTPFDAVKVMTEDADAPVYVKSDGIWYEADMRELERNNVWSVGWGEPQRRERTVMRIDSAGRRVATRETYVDYGPRDVLLGLEIGRVGLEQVKKFYDRFDRYCHGRGKQLGSKRLRQLGLQNGVVVA